MKTLTSLCFTELLEEGLAYRYSAESWKRLEGKGHLFPSPTRTVRVGGEEYIDELIQPPLAPVLLTDEELQQLQMIARCWPRFVQAQRRAIEQIGPNDPFIGQVMTQRERAWFEQPGPFGQETPFVRLDCLRTPNGFKVIDINTTRPAGLGDLTILQEHFACQARDTITGFPTRAIFNHAVNNLATEWIKQTRQTLDEGLILASERDGDYHNFRLLGEMVTDIPLKTARMIDPMTLTEDSLAHTCVIRSRIKETHPAFPFMEAAWPSRACILSPLFKRWFGNKAFIAMFQNDQAARGILSELLGSDEACQQFLQIFPPTSYYGWGVKFEAEGLAQQPKNQLMVKAPAGSSGHGITIGREISQNKWEEILLELHESNRPYVLQEFQRFKEPVEVLGEQGEPVEQQLYTKYGVFIIGGNLAGVEVMARPSSLVHGARDTYLTCVMCKRAPQRSVGF